MGIGACGAIAFVEYRSEGARIDKDGEGSA